MTTKKSVMRQKSRIDEFTLFDVYALIPYRMAVVVVYVLFGHRLYIETINWFMALPIHTRMYK